MQITETLFTTNAVVKVTQSKGSVVGPIIAGYGSVAETRADRDRLEMITQLMGTHNISVTNAPSPDPVYQNIL